MCRTNELRLFSCFLHTLQVTVDGTGIVAATALVDEATGEDFRTLGAAADDFFAPPGDLVVSVAEADLAFAAAVTCDFRCTDSGPRRVKTRSQWSHLNGPPLSVLGGDTFGVVSAGIDAVLSGREATEQ